jgi:hypothetical protein
MAWERRGRGDRLFYYRSARIAGRPRKIYLGRGPDARAQAERVAQARDRRRAERQALRGEQARVAAADRAFEQARGLADLLMKATLIIRNLHLRRGEWRHRRDYARRR